MREDLFYNPSRGYLSFGQVIGEIIRYIQEIPDRFYDVIVGCDSSSSDSPEFPLVVVVLRKGEGGRFFLKRIHYQNKKFYNWKTRILEEVLLSCDLALDLREELEKEIKNIGEPLSYEFRYIHADIGEAGQTREMIREVAGIIRGNGFEPKLKPEAFAASNVADRYT
ncbi:MAG: ribonuclease H-like YkuK family protein [bacterium]|nr:ribonuclease H-like YkuK family protein [bacterium]